LVSVDRKIASAEAEPRPALPRYAILTSESFDLLIQKIVVLGVNPKAARCPQIEGIRTSCISSYLDISRPDENVYSSAPQTVPSISSSRSRWTRAVTYLQSYTKRSMQPHFETHHALAPRSAVRNSVLADRSTPGAAHPYSVHRER